MKKILFLMILSQIIIFINSQDKPDDLEINILPSDKYRLSKRDLLNLKTDLERQMMQRVYEIQSSWDQRNKLRHFALRPPMQPSLPYKSPIYNPNLLTLFSKPSPDGHRDMSTINNAGFSGYSFSQKNKKREDSEIDSVESLKEHDGKIEKAKKNLEAEIDKKFQMILSEKEKILQSMNSSQAKKTPDLKETIKSNKNVTDTSPLHQEKNSDKSSKNNNRKEKIKTDAETTQKNKPKESSNENKIQPGLDYDSIAEVMTKMFEKLNKKMEKSAILRMIHGKDKNQIMQLMSFIKEHPGAVFQSASKTEKKEVSKEVSSQEESKQSNDETKEKKPQETSKKIGKKIETQTENKNEMSFENEVKSEIKNDIPIQIENKNEIDNDSKYFKSVSPFDEDSEDKKDQIHIKYKNQARFLSTKTEIQTEEKSANLKKTVKNTSNLKGNKLKMNKGKTEENKTGDESSQFIFQDGPINLEIF